MWSQAAASKGLADASVTTGVRADRRGARMSAEHISSWWMVRQVKAKVFIA